MKWVEVRQNRWATECGRYEIDGAIHVNAAGPVRRYEGRRTRKHEEGPHCVCVDISSLARCQEHCGPTMNRRPDWFSIAVFVAVAAAAVWLLSRGGLWWLP